MTYGENKKMEMIVFRVPKKLEIDAQKLADKKMISKSAICRTALFEYLSAEAPLEYAETMRQY